MNFELTEKIANAVLYEGYLLYPYRQSSIKNQQRWNFGVLYPESYDTSSMQTECLTLTGEGAALDVKLRFLQDGPKPVERAVSAPGVTVRDVAAQPLFLNFQFEPICGDVEIAATHLADRLFRVTVRIRNLTPLERGGSREEAIARSLLSTHTILRIRDGEFISMLDPPEQFRAETAACHNIGTWPVLSGEEGDRDTMLSSPIILYDYPRIAPESAGDLFDGTEIDEILSLRIMTLTEEEKQEVRQGDERARQILDRTEQLPAEQFMKLHGAIRGLRRISEEES